MTLLADLSKPSDPKKRKSRAKDPNNPRKGGRPAGSLNKQTVAALEKAKANALTVHKLSLASLRETARYLASAMALKQPWLPDGSPRPGGDYRTFMELAVLQLRYLEAITPYEAPRLGVLAVVPQSERQRTMVNVTIFDERGGKIFSDATIDGEAISREDGVLTPDAALDDRRPGGEEEAA